MDPKRYLSESGHIHTLLVPQQITSTTSTDVINFENYSHATVIISIGAAAHDDFTVTGRYCDDNTPSTSTAMAFNYRYMVDGAGATDTLGAQTAATTSGLALTTSFANATVIIEIDASEIATASSSANSRFRLTFTDAGSGDLTLGVVAIMTEPKYAGNTPVTCID